MKNIVVLIGAGAIGQAIARRISQGRDILLADISDENLNNAEKLLLNAGFNVSKTKVDVSSRNSVESLIISAKSLGEIVAVIHTAGVSPSQATPEMILKVDLYGTALILEQFGNVISSGGSCTVIGSQSGHRLPPLTIEQHHLLATTPADKLLDLELLKPEAVRDALHAYQLSKRGNSLRVMAEAVRWGKRNARVNIISPGIIITPLAYDELNGPRGDIYKKMIEKSVARRAGTPDEVGSLAAFLMGPDGVYITGSDILIDGGVTATYWYGENESPN